MTTQNICNICGANCEYRDGKWRCPACGAYRPEEISNEEETLLYNAAQQLRLCAFDDAEELYRDITVQYPKNSRGYWGLVLAKYGIKYEKDYDGKMVPSCYAASYESIFGDENYKKALQYADKDNRAYYEAQAKRIDVIRREWVEKAEREEPYDIFLSYKDSDEENNIERTDDSRDAYELYSKLKEKGYRVFYSRESLAGKEGEKFEPYIFNALNTAQVMIVYGTKPEYIESTWVKNEWMRYYKRIERGEKQKNSLILAYKGLNPSKLPKPLCDIQGIDLGRITVGFGDLETRVANILSAARMSQKIARVSVKGRERRTAEHIRRLNTVKVGKVVSEEPKSERARIATRTLGGKSVKLSVNAEKSLSVAESYLARGQFTEAEERFDEILLSSPRNGRALTGKLLAQSNVQDLPDLEKNGFRVFPDVPLIESVLSNAEKSSAESVLRALCAEASRSFDRGDIAQAKLIVSVVREYAGSAVDKLRGDLYERGLNLVATDEESAKYFLDIHLSFEEDEEEYIKKLHTIVNSGIEHSAFTFAGYYADKLKEEDANNYETQLSLLKIEYKTKDEAEVFRCIDREKAYQKFEDVLSELEPKSAARWLRACFSEIAELLQKGIYAGALRWIEICAKYQFAGRKASLETLLSICISSASMRSSECFDAILTYVADGDTSVYADKAKTFADTAPKAKEFDAAKLYYGKILSVNPDCVVAAQGKFFADIRCANEKELPFALVNLTDWSCFEEVLAVQTDEREVLKWIKKLADACMEHIGKAGESSNEIIFSVFEKLLSYIPIEYNDILLGLLRKAADICLQKGLFVRAQKYYEMYIGEKADDSAVYWGLLQAKLKCRNDEELIRQPQPIGTFDEFENAQVCAADDKTLLNHYIDVRDSQSKHIKAVKKRKRIIKIGAVALAAVILISAALIGWFTYYNSQSALIYGESNGGYVVSAGRFYNSESRLVIPAEVDGRAVVEIADNAFSDHEEIEELVLPASIQKIGANAFAGCVNLHTVTFVADGAARIASPQTALYEIGNGAFSGCGKLTSFELPYGLESIGGRAFAYTNLNEVTIPNTVDYIGEAAFVGCNALQMIIVGDRDEIPTEWSENWNEGCSASVEFRLRVIFDYSGVTADDAVKEQYVLFGGEFAFPVPARAGYTFDGWFSGETRLTDGRGNSTKNWQSQSGGVVTAKWAPNINRVIFNANGGSGVMPEQEIATDERATLSANTFTRKGYTFAGWAESATGSVVYRDGAEYRMGTDSSYELFAVWEANRYNIELDANGGTTEADNLQVAFGSQYALPVPVLDGYNFLGWYDGTEETATAYTDDSGDGLVAWSFAENKTLYAHWKRVRFVITLNYEGADGNADIEFVYVWTGNEYSLPVPSRENCEFGGWYSEADGNGTLIADWQGNGVGVWSGESDIVAYALWYEYTEGLMFELNDDDGYTLTGISDKNIDEVVIPRHYNGRPVTRIAETALQNCINMRSLTVPSTVTEIAGGALYGCGSLKELTLPFIGASREAEGEQAVLGFLFGKTEYENSIKVSQFYSSESYVDFYLSKSLVSVRVTDATTIGFGAFSYCTNLTSITLPENLTNIGDYAFRGCSFADITIPKGVTSIGRFAFADCCELTSIQIPRSVKSIGNDVFSGCRNLIIYCEAASQPGGWDSWWNGSPWTDDGWPVIWDCNNNSMDSNGYMYTVINGLRYKLKGEEATVIEQSANISGEVVIPSNVTYMGQSYRVTSIGDSAFNDCSSLTGITIPEGITNIGNSAFYNCNSLASVVLPKGVTNIGYNVFRNCSNLQSIVIPEGVTSIGDGAFNNCSNLSNIVLPESLNSIGSQAFEVYNNLSCLTNITIPVGVVSIGYFAFAGRGCLTIYCEAEIKPSGWNSDWNRGSSVVWNCKNNDVDEAGYAYAVINGLKFSFKDNEASVETQSISTCGDIFIPSSVIYNGITYNVTSIAANAFRHCEGIKSIIIPEGVTSIGASAFEDCNNLTIIVIPESVTSIGGSAFYGCRSLTSLELPSGITNIGSYAFNGCTALTNLIIPSNVTDIGESAFAWCSGLINITIPKGVVVMGRNAFQGYKSIIYCEVESLPEGWNNSWNSSGCPVIWNCNNGSGDSNGWVYTVIEGIHYGLHDEVATVIGQPIDLSGEIIIPASITYEGQIYGVTSVSNYAFAYCSEITKIVIPDSVTYIADYTFYNCSNLTDISILGSVTQIGEYAFAYCNNLRNITIPESVWRIGDDAFVGCSSLTSITIPENVTSIGVLAFANCSSLKSVVFSENSQLRTIDRMVFQYCTGLTSIVIPESVTSVGDYAFRGCSNITIYCEATSQPDGWGSNWNPDDCPVVWGYEVQ